MDLSKNQPTTHKKKLMQLNVTSLANNAFD